MYHLFFATPEKVLLDEDIISLKVPGTLGYFEILAHHAQIVSTLRSGKLTVKNKDEKKLYWKLSGGYVEMIDNKVTLLADSALPIEPPPEL